MQSSILLLKLKYHIAATYELFRNLYNNDGSSKAGDSKSKPDAKTFFTPQNKCVRAPDETSAAHKMKQNHGKHHPPDDSGVFSSDRVPSRNICMTSGYHYLVQSL